MTKKKKQIYADEPQHGLSEGEKLQFAGEPEVTDYDLPFPNTDPHPEYHYRYFCDACTNIAFYAVHIKEGLTGNCGSCGKKYVARKENFIKL